MQQYKAGFDENKLKVRALENELLLTSKQLEEERSRQRDLKKKVDEVEEEKGLTNQQYEAKIAQVQEDMEELKNRLVAVTRYSWFPIFLRRLNSNCTKRRETRNCYACTNHGKRSICSQALEKCNAAKRGKTHVVATKCGKNVTAEPQQNAGKHVTTAKRGKTHIVATKRGKNVTAGWP